MIDELELDDFGEEGPTVLTIEEEQVDAIVADVVDVNQSGVRTLQAEVVHAEQSAIMMAEANTIEITQSGVFQAQGQSVSVAQSGVAVITGEEVELENTFVGLIAAQNVSGDATILIDVKAAIVAGVPSSHVDYPTCNRRLFQRRRPTRTGGRRLAGRCSSSLQSAPHSTPPTASSIPSCQASPAAWASPWVQPVCSSRCAWWRAWSPPSWGRWPTGTAAAGSWWRPSSSLPWRRFCWSGAISFSQPGQGPLRSHRPRLRGRHGALCQTRAGGWRRGAFLVKRLAGWRPRRRLPDRSLRLESPLGRPGRPWSSRRLAHPRRPGARPQDSGADRRRVAAPWPGTGACC
jgi:hypothetical protein